MAFTNVNEIPAGTASRTLAQRSFTRIWQVESDEVVHPYLASLAIPVREGDAFPFFPLARCVDIESSFESGRDSRVIYLVTAKYETKTAGGGEDEQEQENEDPIADRPSIRWSSRTTRLPVRFTSDAPPKPIQNSAGEPFDPTPEEDFHVLVFNYQHNIQVYDESRAKEYRGAINNDNYTLAGLNVEPYQSRIVAIEATNAERNGSRYWTESVTIEIVDDWRLVMPDEGFRRLAPPAEFGDANYEGGDIVQYVPVLDATGVPVNTPVLLDGAGGALPPNAEPFLLFFRTRAKPEKAFAPLGLPTTPNL